MVVKNDVFKAIKENKKSLKPSNINGFKDFICGTPEGTRTPDLLVRSQSLYPAELPARNTLLNCKYALYTKTTVWFVASHSIQLSYQRIYVLHFLCLDNITQIKQKCNTFFIFYKDYLKYIFQEYLRQAPQAPGTGAFYSILLCEARQAANRGRALKDREAHGILLSRFPL